MRYFAAAFVLLVAGCIDRPPLEHSHTHFHVNTSDELESLNNENELTNFRMNWRFRPLEDDTKYASELTKDILERVKILERVTGGRHFELQKHLIELEETK